MYFSSCSMLFAQFEPSFFFSVLHSFCDLVCAVSSHMYCLVVLPESFSFTIVNHHPTLQGPKNKESIILPASFFFLLICLLSSHLPVLHASGHPSVFMPGHRRPSLCFPLLICFLYLLVFVLLIHQLLQTMTRSRAN